MSFKQRKAVMRAVLTGVTVLTLALSAWAADKVKVGDQVPAFKVPSATAEAINVDGISNTDLLGKRYVLAFYPADWSGGCTQEMCTLRDSFKEFETLGAEVYPVSADLVFSHKEWAAHHQLPFTLLADQTREFGKAMGVYMPDVGMFHRSVFIVGPDGKFEYVDYDYSLKDDSDFNELKEKLAELKK